MKPNVLQIVGSFHQGGSERQAVQVTRLLLESGRYNVHLACLDPSGPLRAEADALGLEIPSFPLTSFYDANAARQLRRFARYLRERRIEVVQAYDFYTNVFGMGGAALARVPVRIAARRETDGMRTRAQKVVERQAFRLAHVVAANSDAVGRELVRDGVPARKIVTVYNGMDTRRVRPLPDLNREETLASLGLPADGARRFVTSVANMRHPVKDQATFLRAARRVREQVSDAAFVLAGEGALVESYRALAEELGIGEHTFFTGRCARVAELLAVSSVCVLSSRGVEGFSNSIIEYMAAARPVVATDVGGAAEAVADGETGYVIRPGDDEALAARVTELLKDPERAREMGERGLSRVREKFSCEAQLARVEALYARMLGESGGRAKVPTPAASRSAAHAPDK
ncbi:MAG TPA: glycosyltransferase [Pyrinomonadaceae bacterium]|jgi:glycosyltransferase involved in cell wall biosynthesis|nr:glycosyltransferase [Pyrinomonadaceae bacterium]